VRSEAKLAPATDDAQHCAAVVARAVLLRRHCDSEPTEPFAGAADLS
jgi:hypothetical protein